MCGCLALAFRSHQMVKATRSKLSTALRAALEDTSAPVIDVNGGETLAKIVESRGKSQFLVETPAGARILTAMPPKFRNALWIHRGTFVIVSLAEGSGELLHVLSKEQIKELRREHRWPAEFEEKPVQDESASEEPLLDGSASEGHWQGESADEESS